MKEILFTGSGVAIVTPFHAGAVNFPAFGRLIDRQIDGGTDAIIVCGTTGEAATMTQKERMETIAYCVDRVAGRVPVIAGTGANDTQVARENALAAERLGVDGLLIVTPYYNKATQQGLLRHYKVIADSVGTPIILQRPLPHRGQHPAGDLCGAGPTPQHRRCQGGQREFQPNPKNPEPLPCRFLHLVRQ